MFFLSEHQPYAVLLRFLSIFLLCAGIFYGHATYAQKASYAPAARSATSANTMIDNVVGNRHSLIKSQTTDTGDLYHIDADGTVTAPNALIVNPGCSVKGSSPLPEVHSRYRFDTSRRGKGFETVMIGVSNQPDQTTPQTSPTAYKTVRRATLNASFGPSGIYILPRPCKHENASDETLTTDAATALAAADGNAFTLAGNRDTVEDVDTAHHFLNGDIQLISTLPLDLSASKTFPPGNSIDKAETVALPMLRRIVLQPYITVVKGVKSQTISAEGMRLTHSPDIYRLIQPYIGHPVTFRKMHKLTGEISVYFRKHGHAFISINVPPQTVHNGILHINVMEYRLGHITVHGNQWISAWVIKRDSGLTLGQTLTLDSLKTSLEWVNLNPFRTVDMIYSPGTKPGLTDVNLHVTDRFPVYGYAAINNQADLTLGRMNWYVGISWGNVFGLGHILTYQFNRTDSHLFNSHTASWTIPFTSRNSLQIFGGYSIAHPITASPWINIGKSGQASIRWLNMINHVTLGNDFGIDGTLQLGFDWKTTNSDQYDQSNQARPQFSNADTDQFVFAYNGSIQDPWGQTQINNQFFYGPGKMSHYDKRSNYKSIFPYAKPNYIYDRIILTRSISLPKGLFSTTKMSFQRASTNLLYSEQLMIGGIGNARGYPANTSFGSNANTLSEEILAPSFSLANMLDLPQLEDTNRIGFFWDWADNHQIHHTHNTGSHATTLSSIGVDVTSSFNQRLNVTFDAGWRLRRLHKNSIAGKRGIFCDFQVVTGF